VKGMSLLQFNDNIAILKCEQEVEVMQFSVIERCDKETEEVVAKEEESFLYTIVTYLKEHKGEFLYIESDEFEEARIESLSIEVDDVFGNYMALFGFKAQKKMGE
jgi:DNA mismatch repair ATPase MutS